jgi:hypothetical protein
MTRWAIQVRNDPWHNQTRYHGGTAVDFGTAHVIHRSVIHSLTAHRSYQAKPTRSRNEHDFKPAES